MGSGLAILSRFPILSSTYLKFTLAGRPLKILQGDFYVGKGCGSVCVDHPDIGLVDIYTTHVNISDHIYYKNMVFTTQISYMHATMVRMSTKRNVSLNVGKSQIA